MGNHIDGTQAKYIRVPQAETSLYPIPAAADEEQTLVLPNIILSTGFECGVSNGKVKVGSSVANAGVHRVKVARHVERFKLAHHVA